MEDILSLINAYGTYVYIVLFAYCFGKSGVLPLFGGYAAQAGALEISLVAFVVLAGGYLGDELRFWLARHYGDGFLQSRPRLNALMDKAKLMLKAYGTAYIFLYRYPKGMRTIGALPVGLTPMPWIQFTLLNFGSAAVWTTLLVGAGYLFGAAIEEAIVAGWGAVSVLLLVLFLGATWLAWKRMAATAL